MAHPTNSFADDVCTAVCQTVLTADGTINSDDITAAVGDHLRAEFSRRVNALERALDLVEHSDHGSADAAFALEQDLQTARDAESDLFTAGYARLTRALDACGDTITVTPHAFDPDQMTCYIDPEQFGVTSGDTVLTALSLNTGTDALDMTLYPLFRTDTGLHCGGPDRNRSSEFPVCKHELAALLQLAAHLCASDTAIPPGRDAYAAVLDHADDILDHADDTVKQPAPTADLTATL